MADNIVAGLKQFEMPNPAAIGLQIANLGNIAAEAKIRNKEVRDQQSWCQLTRLRMDLLLT